MKFLQWLHRWTGLILLIQLLLWTVSGLYFALVDHHGMSGRQHYQPLQSEPLSQTQLTNISASWWDDLSGVTKVHSYTTQGLPRVEVHHQDGIRYLDGRDGSEWQTDQDFAQQIAQASYSGPGSMVRATPIERTRELHDWRGQGFRIDFDDDLNTRVYVDRASGTVIDHRNTPWVVADWMFRLHFIDYTGGRNFNNLVAIAFAVMTLWFALSGFILLVKLLNSGEMRFTLRKASLTASVGEQQFKFNDKAHKTVLQVLQHNDIAVASGCGGGGTCGFCTVKTAPDTPITVSDRAQLSQAQLDEGYRLACQHSIETLHKVEVPAVEARKYALQLINSRFITPMLKELRFAVIEGEGEVEYAAGQYLQFLIPAGAGRSRPADVPEEFAEEWHAIEASEFKHDSVRRSYSMATAAGGNELVFTVRYQPQTPGAPAPGVGSSYLCNLKPGETIVAEGPFGDFQRLEGDERKLCFIGGGAGMAPLRALIQEELQSQQPRPMRFFYGARNRGELLYTDEFVALNNLNKVSFTAVLSEPRKTCQWGDAEGFVHEVARAWLEQQDISEYDFYICGPPRMLAATLAMLKELNVDSARVRYDDFGN
ncbi:2Fe-2S iron-sulfur cluster-binding protein [Aliidiomarina maris]|uniref:NADH:ubiquinone oxidoreductase n=1 Tax=Aliidiomarina maris TaxID=531312 RepID=A0A327X0I6_9GAMM|nr:2Fe-2S iron-sulfur cluster-binding protein [Aliidiomarina maris]MCL5051512.1 PepSY domain-containing protein [Bacillota bacterium]RAJ98804.1 Na(+)-translocating NADH:ubiquinone oxidoreductase F subunit [Aliidiomarina maris]RUO24953.1 NADH:ubiquinone oxidoreductase [Aliidiomarina maris]